MKYLLQIKEGPHGGPFYDTVNKWISSRYAAVFTKDPLDKIGTNPVSADVERFIELFNTTQNDDSIILSIWEDETTTDNLYIYQKNGSLEEITSLSVDKKNYKTCNYVDNVIGFKIKLLEKIKVVECPLVLATIKSNSRLTMETFKSIEDPNNPESHMNAYFGNIKALEYILNDKT